MNVPLAMASQQNPPKGGFHPNSRPARDHRSIGLPSRASQRFMARRDRSRGTFSLTDESEIEIRNTPLISHIPEWETALSWYGPKTEKDAQIARNLGAMDKMAKGESPDPTPPNRPIEFGVTSDSELPVMCSMWRSRMFLSILVIVFFVHTPVTEAALRMLSCRVIQPDEGVGFEALTQARIEAAESANLTMPGPNATEVELAAYEEGLLSVEVL